MYIWQTGMQYGTNGQTRVNMVNDTVNMARNANDCGTNKSKHGSIRAIIAD